MNIYSKIDQFIKSAKHILSKRQLYKQAAGFILLSRDFKKQSAYPSRRGVNFDYTLGPRIAAAVQNGVNLNPRPPKSSHHRSSSPPRQQAPQRHKAPDSKETWSQIANDAQTPEDLQEMLRVGPELLKDRPDAKALLDRGMRYAVGRINRATGSTYSWSGGKLNLSNTTTNLGSVPTTPTTTSMPTTTAPTTAPRTPGYTPKSTTTPTTRTTTPPGGTPTEYGFSADKSSLDGIPLTAMEKAHLTLGDARAKDLIRRKRKMSADGEMAKTYGVKGTDGTYSLTLKGGDPVTPTSIPTNTPTPTATDSTYSWTGGKLNLSNMAQSPSGSFGGITPMENPFAAMQQNFSSTEASNDLWGSVNPWIQQASPFYERHRNSSNIDLKLNASEYADIISDQIEGVLRQNPNLTMDDALTQLNIAGTALGNDVKDNLTRRLGSFSDFGEQGRAAAEIYQSMQDSPIVQPYNQPTAQYSQQNPQQGSTMNPNSTSSGEYDYLDEMEAGLNRSTAKGKKRVLPGMPDTQQQQTRRPPTVASQYGYGAPPSQSGKQPTFRPSPQKQVPTTSQPKAAPTQGWTPAGQPQQQPQKPAVQRYKPTLPMNNGNYQLGTAYTQDEYNTVKAEYYKLREFWEALPEEQKNNPNAQRKYNNMLQQLKTYGNTYQTRMAEQANNPVPKTTNTKQWLNPNTGKPDVPSAPPAPVQPPNPPVQPVQPPTLPVPAPVAPQTNTQSAGGKSLTWKNPATTKILPDTTPQKTTPSQDGWQPKSQSIPKPVQPTARSISPIPQDTNPNTLTNSQAAKDTIAPKVPQPTIPNMKPKPVVKKPFDSRIDTSFNGAGKEQSGVAYNGYASQPTKPAPKKPLNWVNPNTGKQTPQVPTNQPAVQKNVPSLQLNLNNLQGSSTINTSYKSTGPYVPRRDLNPEYHPSDFKEHYGGKSVVDL